MPNYCVIFRMAYRVSSAADLRLGGVTIGRKPPFPVETPPPIRLASQAEFWHQSHAQREEFQTDTFYWFYASRDGLDELTRYANEEVDPVVCFAISYLAGFSVETELASIYNASTGLLDMYQYSPAIRQIVNHDPDEAFLNTIAEAIAADETSTLASNELSHARRLYAGSSAISGAERILYSLSLLHCVRAMEYIVRDDRLAIAASSDASIDPQRQKQIDKLIADLGRNRGLQYKVSRVAAAHNEISKAEVRYLDLKLAALAKELALPPSWLERAKRLTKLRNRNIAHGGSRTAPELPPFAECEAVVEDAILAFVYHYLLQDEAVPHGDRGSSFPSDAHAGSPIQLDWSNPA